MYIHRTIENSMKPSDRKRLRLFSEFAHCNPFFPQRIELERQVLGKSFVDDDAQVWSRSIGSDSTERPNVIRLTELANQMAERFCQQLTHDSDPDRDVLEQYWDVVTYALLYRHIVPLKPEQLLEIELVKQVWNAFEQDYRRLASVPGLQQIETQSAPHLFALVCQIHRAFYNIFHFILGDSSASVNLRGAVWQSVFTTDLKRYRRSLYHRMGELTSLITGPSGTGKELVARAIGLSQYVPFDERSSQFRGGSEAGFYPLNLAALSPTLVESELFGHRKGAFTGAIGDRKGWLEQCPADGAIFLDEIGELELGLQVKLLRVVQQRTFSRIGDSKERTFCGKIIAATNRDLQQQIECGEFREDFYYRLCADRIETPSLQEQLTDRPEDLHSLCLYIATKLAGSDGQRLADQSVDWILQHLGRHYPWRGNIRELEQCVASIMIRGQYRPACVDGKQNVASNPQWIQQTLQGDLSADQLLQKYCTLVYHQTGTYESAAAKLKVDRRTVKAKIDRQLLEQLQSCSDHESPGAS